MVGRLIMMKRIIAVYAFLILFNSCAVKSATYNTDLHTNYNSALHINVVDNGAIGDGVTNDKSAIDNAIFTARALGKNVYFPDGTYLYAGTGLDAGGIRFYGESKSGTIIMDNIYTRGHNIDGAENITLQNIRITDYGLSASRIFKNCKFISTINDGNFEIFHQGVYVEGTRYEFIDCDFVYDNVYTVLWLRKYNSAIIKNCTFTGTANHPIRIDLQNIPNAKIEIVGNVITGGRTGIFVGSNRELPLEGGLIEGNTLYRQTEESIALDGFGDTPSLCPVIANGPISSVSNDANGRLVIGMDNMVYHDGVTTNVSSPVSLRTDWTNFYFSLDQGSHQEGTIVKIYSYNNTANTLTLDTYLNSNEVKVGGFGGVQSGFFNWTIRNNTIIGNGVSNTYATAISAYLNVFNTKIENNNVKECAHGISLAGGLMLSTYYTLSYNNILSGNSFIDCDQVGSDAPSSNTGVVRILSYNNGHKQYNNKFINNTVNGGRIYIEKQENFSYYGNTLINTIEIIVW